METEPETKLDNLIPFTKETAREMGRKGGQTVTKKKILALSMNSRKYCVSGCPMYPCLYQPFSVSEFGGRCALKSASPKMQHRMNNIFLSGRSGVVRELANTLVELSVISDRTPTRGNLTLYFDKLVKYHEIVHGKKKTSPKQVK